MVYLYGSAFDLPTWLVRCQHSRNVPTTDTFYYKLACTSIVHSFWLMPIYLLTALYIIFLLIVLKEKENTTANWMGICLINCITTGHTFFMLN
jgi:hypothetical protein